MELRHLRYLVALANTLSFTKAAAQMHVTQSTLSHQIRQLEEEVGQPLFNRIGRKVQITEAGSIFLEHVSGALASVDQGVQAINGSSRQSQQAIKVGTTQSFNQRLVPSCAATFVERYPDIRLAVEELSAEEIARRVADQELDFGVSYRSEAHATLWFEQLYNEELVLAVGPQHPLYNRRKIRMHELTSVRLALLPSYFSTRTIIDECFASIRVEPIVAVELNAVAPLLELVRISSLAAIVSRSAFPGRRNKRSASSNDVKFVLLEDPTPIRTPGLVWRRGSARAQAANYFAGIIRTAAKE